MLRKSNLIVTVGFLFALSAFAQDKIEIKCDSIYYNKNIHVTLTNFNNESDGYTGEKNSVITIEANKKLLIKDSIFSKTQKVEFADFNNDNFKDILVQNISDVRSNWTYYLYLYNPKTNTFSKISGFEEIKNPTYNSKYNIIESHFVSGQDWVSFYGIKNARVFDYKLKLLDDHGANFEKKYRSELAKIALKK